MTISITWNKDIHEKFNKYVSNTKQWMIMNAAVAPYLVERVLYQVSEGVHKAYPEFKVMFIGTRFSKDGDDCTYFSEAKEYRQSAVTLFSDMKLMKKLYSDFEKSEKAYLDFAEEVKNKGYDFLHKNYDKFIELYDAEYIPALPQDGMVEYGDELVGRLKKKYPDNIKEIDAMILPLRETFISAEHKELLRIALRLKKSKKKYLDDDSLLKDKKAFEELKEHQSRFHWIQNNYKDVKALPISYFAGKLLELMRKDTGSLEHEHSELSSYNKKQADACENVRKSKIFSEEDYESLHWIGKILWWTDRRKLCNMIGDYFIAEHLKWLCKKHSIQYNDALFLVPEEMDEIAKGKKKITDFPIAERKKSSILVDYMLRGRLFISGKDADELWKKIMPDMNLQGIKELKGNSAYLGKVKGKARIILNANDADDFNQGEILVTGMTRPEFVPLMKKAGAIVTDDGGITCHAAIIARELKKPCIIGTKIATKVLKDGDFVEVDATNGVVRKIK